MPSAARRPSARYRSVVIVLILALLLLGFFALGRLSTGLPAEPSASMLEIRVSAPGLTAPVIEARVARHIESALAGTPGMASMSSAITAGTLDLTLQVSPYRDIAAVQRDVVMRLEHARQFLPASLDPPTVSPGDDPATRVELVLTSGKHDSLALRDWVEAEFARRLRELDGVTRVEVEGGTVREILVMPDQRRLAGYGLSLEDVWRSIRKHPEPPIPVFQTSENSPRRDSVLTGNLAAIAALPVLLADGESIRLSEVARLALVPQPSTGKSGGDGKEQVKVTVHKQAHARLTDVIERIRAHGDWMQANRLIPEGIGLEIRTTKLDAARHSLAKAAFALLSSFLLVLFIVQMFWGSARRTLIVGVIVMLALQGVFVVLALSGKSLDAVTLGGFAAVTGLIGSTALLSFDKRLSPGDSPIRRVLAVATPVAFLVTVLAPAIVEGIGWGSVFHQLVPAWAGMWILAAGLAGWLVPMFNTRRVPQTNASGPAAFQRFIGWLGKAYDAWLRYLLPRAAITISFVVTAIGLLTALLLATPRESRMPEGPPTQETVLSLRGEDSSVVAGLADDIARLLRQVDGVREVVHTGQHSSEALSLQLDEDRARELGVDIAGVGKALAFATTGIPAGRFRDAGHQYHVRLQLPPGETGLLASGKILLLGELENRPAVHLRDVAVLERVVAPARLLRRNGLAEVEIQVHTQDEAILVEALEGVRQIIRRAKLPPGYQLHLGRQDEQVLAHRAWIVQGLSLLLLVVLAPLITRSLRVSLFILVCATAVWCLVFSAAMLLGLAWSPPVWLGLIVSLGLSAGFAAFLVHTMEASASPSNPAPDIKRAARSFFRPALGMTMTGVAGMLPLILINAGAPELSTLVSTMSLGLLISLVVMSLAGPLFCRWPFRMEQNPTSPRL